MDRKHHSFAKHFRKYTAAVLMAVPLLVGHQLTVFAASTVELEGDARVYVRACSVEHSAGTVASLQKDGEDKIILSADLSEPGDWASFTFTVENDGPVDAYLAKVNTLTDASDDLLISFGISQADVGEALKAGEKCDISVVVQLDAEKEDSVSASGDFTLTLVYETDGAMDIPIPPQTGDGLSLMPAVSLMLLGIALLMLWNARRHCKKDE